MAKADLEEFYGLVAVGDTVELVGQRNEETAQLFGDGARTGGCRCGAARCFWRSPSRRQHPLRAEAQATSTTTNQPRGARNCLRCGFAVRG